MARCSAALCRSLARRGHEVTVVTAQLSASDPLEERLDEVRVRRFAGPAFLARRLVPWGRGLSRFLRDELADINVAHLHGHRSGIAVTARRELAAADVPWVLLSNGTYPHHGQHTLAKRVFDGLWGARVVSGAAALIAVSEAEARELPRAASVVPNGVAACATSAAAPREPGRLLFVGSDRPQKRALRFLALLGALPGASLTLVGRYDDAFRRRFGGFGARVAFAGVLPAAELGSRYAGAALLVQPAVGEAFGLAPFEAAMAGTGGVVAGGHGCGEWFGRAGGCVVRPDDDRALAEAVGRRLSDPTLAAHEASVVAGFARRELTWERAAEQVEAVYGDVLSRRRRQDR
jgi:glycosyltransferase involved in cell wall biosynthesis